MARGETARLSKRTVDAIEPPETGFNRVWDAELKGFHVRVRANGRKTYEFRYRVGRRQTTLTIGDHGTFTAEQAREEAVEHKRSARRGQDPLTARRAIRDAITVRELIERYLEEGPADRPNKRASSWDTDAGYLRLHVVPLLGARPARDLTAGDLSRWQKDVASGKTAALRPPAQIEPQASADLPQFADAATAAAALGLSESRLTDLRRRLPPAAVEVRTEPVEFERGGRVVRSTVRRVLYNVAELTLWNATRRKRRDSRPRGGKGCATRAMCSLSAMLTWAVQNYILDDNPARRVQKLPGGNRELFLSSAEAAGLWSKMAEMERAGSLRPADADLFRLLALTGARRGEILGLRWKEIGWENGLIVLEPDRHKTGAKGRKRIIQLNAAALDLLHKRQRQVTPNNARLRRIVPWVFPAADGSAPMKPPKRAWARLTAAANLPGLRVHDLRHTYASLLVQDGVPLAIVGKALGHAKASTTERYAHLKDDAAQRASDHVAAIYTPKIGEGAG